VQPAIDRGLAQAFVAVAVVAAVVVGLVIVVVGETLDGLANNFLHIFTIFSPFIVFSGLCVIRMDVE